MLQVKGDGVFSDKCYSAGEPWRFSGVNSGSIEPRKRDSPLLKEQIFQGIGGPGGGRSES
ncbi:hypothetical protein P7K49_004462 [Saguinus oedipus]|uniref:Uncharacterized protein n=1 Tax=Saguinus oedipus TaxID=9490 RepID=A0ABQ9W870_SAGOE|nr:hypothetical protein P7K49_004462 [Saguinus oedipus]